ncbi:MAG: hypothetical protein OEY89_09000 [Gammaproteobacteria bacterium]|nr:hypothetical protein [Gammaproteobacteria bacterium]
MPIGSVSPNYPAKINFAKIIAERSSMEDAVVQSKIMCKYGDSKDCKMMKVLECMAYQENSGGGRDGIESWENLWFSDI